MALKPLEKRFVAAYKKYGGNESLIDQHAQIHPTQQQNMSRVPEIATLLAAHDQNWEPIPSEPQLLAEILAMARKANATGEYTSSIKSYEAYGRRAFGWRNEQRTELTGADGGPIEIAAVRERLIASLASIEVKATEQ